MLLSIPSIPPPLQILHSSYIINFIFVVTLINKIKCLRDLLCFVVVVVVILILDLDSHSLSHSCD